MATRKGNTHSGEYTGKVGTAVLSPWKNIMTMRSLPRRRKKPKSTKLVRQNDLFKMVTEFLYGALPAISIGYQQTKKASMTKVNAATSYHLLHAVVQGPADPAIDMAKIKLSKPIWLTQPAWKTSIVAEPNRIIRVSWQLNPFPHKSTRLDDQAVMAIYDDQIKKFYVRNESVDREALTCTIRTNPCTEGHDYFCYLFMVSADGKLVSPTQYLGAVTIIA